jgi:hypothetical protein
MGGDVRSCVTMMMVCPCRCSSLNTCMISSLVVLSRLPVGSSARRIDGSLTSARDRDALALATREPFGRWSMWLPRPTRLSAALARTRRSLADTPA